MGKTVQTNYLQQKLCQKYGLKMSYFLEACINRFYKADTSEYFYINNNCQCNNNKKCSICTDFWALDQLVHNHPYCIECRKAKNCYLAQAEYVYVGGDTTKFPFQKQYSSIFGGVCQLSFPEMEPISESAEYVYKNL